MASDSWRDSQEPAHLLWVTSWGLPLAGMQATQCHTQQEGLTLPAPAETLVRGRWPTFWAPPPRLGPLLEFSKEEMHFWWGGGADECVCVVFSHMCASGYTGVRRFLALWSWVVPVLPHPPWA
jgi:hypothetical protein